MENKKDDQLQDASINWEFIDDSISQREQFAGINSSYRFNRNVQNQSVLKLLGQEQNTSNQNIKDTQQINQMQLTKPSQYQQSNEEQRYKEQKHRSSQNMSPKKYQTDQSQTISQTPGVKYRNIENLKLNKQQQLNSSQAMSLNINPHIDDSANFSQRSRTGRSPFDKKFYNASTLMEKKKTFKNSQTSTNSFININQQKIALRLKQPKQKLKHFTQVVMNLTFVTQFMQIMKDLIFGSLQVKKLKKIEVEALNDLAHSHEQFKASAQMKEQMRTKIMKQKKNVYKRFFQAMFILDYYLYTNYKTQFEDQDDI